MTHINLSAVPVEISHECGFRGPLITNIKLFVREGGTIAIEGLRWPDLNVTLDTKFDISIAATTPNKPADLLAKAAKLAGSGDTKEATRFAIDALQKMAS